MRKIVNALLPSLGLLIPGISFAAWSSGGGELIKDLHNPWFIQNTKKVTYCIVRDDAHFKLNDEEGFPIEALVEKAFKFWKDEFKTSYNPLGDAKDGVKVATQDFVKLNCDQNPDINFQFGHLSTSQLDEMKKMALDPRGFVSLAVRTDYDQVNLKAKGFIYLAADSGPLRPNTDDMLDHPWAEGSGSFIYKILVHELGHVFGLQHQNNIFSFMAPEYPESLLKKGNNGGAAGSGYSYYLPTFFKYSQPKDFWMCLNLEIQPVAIKFFGVPSSWECYETRYKENSFEIWGVVGPRDHDKQELIGTALLEKNGSDRYDMAVSVWLPDSQNVYPPNPSRQGRILYGPMILQQHRKGVYRDASGSIERPISVILSPNIYWNRIGGIMNGQQFLDIQGNL